MAIRIIRNSIFLCLLVFVVSSWSDGLRFRQVKPDILLVVLLWISLHQGAFTGQLSGFFAGLFEDVISLAPLGYYMTSRTLVGLLAGLVRDFIGLDRIFLPFLLTVLAYIIQAVWMTIISLIFAISTTHSPIFSLQFLIGLIYTAVLAPLVFFILDAVARRLATFKGRR